MKLFARAPGKVNLSLFVGARRPDGRHELITLIESVSLADELELVTRVSLEDDVVCTGVEEPNIVSSALAGLRARGWNAPHVQVTIRKHIPIAAGMGGGSADAAAVLRMASRLVRIDDGVVEELAAELGSDVPSQLTPGLVLGTSAGDEVEVRAPAAPHAFVIVPLPHRLSTAAVYAEADRLGVGEKELEFAARLPDLCSSLTPGARLPGRLVVNELEPAAISLCPDISAALDAVRGAGADHAFVSGSGPTVAGLYWGPHGRAGAEAAATALAPRYAGACCAIPVPPDFGFPLFV
ncbi:MAG: 4-(cytidine 5'-diphospho)-2-C-methyl-D-erythritol kinase [Solirubrobacteraceae bacterium]